MSYKRRNYTFEDTLARRADELGLPKRCTTLTEKIMKWLLALLFLATLCSAQTADTVVTVVSSSKIGESVIVEITYPAGAMCNTNPCTARQEL